MHPVQGVRRDAAASCVHARPSSGCVRGRCHSRPTPLPPLRSSREPRGCAPQRLEPHLASPLPPHAARPRVRGRSTRAAPGRPDVAGVAVHLVHVVGVRQATRAAPRADPESTCFSASRPGAARSGAAARHIDDLSSFPLGRLPRSSDRVAPHRTSPRQEDAPEGKAGISRPCG